MVLQGDGKVRWGNENRGTGTAMEVCIFWGWGLDCAVDGCPGGRENATSTEEG